MDHLSLSSISNGQSNEHLLDLFAFDRKLMVKMLRDLATNYEVSFNLILKDHIQHCRLVFSTAESGQQRLNEIVSGFYIFRAQLELSLGYYENFWATSSQDVVHKIRYAGEV